MRAAVIDNEGNVVNIIVADASVDTLPGFVLVDITSQPQVDFGYVYVNGSFELGPELQAQQDALVAEIEQEAWEEV